MRKFILSLLLFCMASAMNAQTIVKGDMNDDGVVNVTDVTSVVNVAVGTTPMEAVNVSVNPYTVDNSLIVGTWYTSGGDSFTFNADGTTGDGRTYKFYPSQGRILLFDGDGKPSYVILIAEVTSQYLLMMDYSSPTSFAYLTKEESLVAGLTMSENTLTLDDGTTGQLTVTATPANAFNANVTWTSSDTSVATVNANGLVTAVDPGTCTITATTTDGSGLTATCEVTVNAVLVESITLSQTTATFNTSSQEAGDRALRLYATVLPENATNKNVTWTSSNTNVATVVDGRVVSTGLRGTATITCTAADGSGVSATCFIVAMANPVMEITLSSSSLSLYKHQTSQLTATVGPASAADKTVGWSSSDESVATVSSNGLVTAVRYGTCVITCWADDGSTTEATCEVTVLPDLVNQIILSESSPLQMVEGTTKQVTATVKPTIADNKTVVWSSNKESVATVSDGLITAIQTGSCTITCSAVDGSNTYANLDVQVLSVDIPSSYVDLGLPSGTRWATCNIGSVTPEGYGIYYAWGEFVPKASYDWTTYYMYEGSLPFSASSLTKYTSSDGLTELQMPPTPDFDDVASYRWGSGWRIPSVGEFQELINTTYTTTTWTTQNGVYGRLITSNSNGNSIFMPAAGYRYDTTLGGDPGDEHGYAYYWSRSLDTGITDSSAAYILSVGEFGISTSYRSRYYGCPIRPVYSENYTWSWH